MWRTRHLRDDSLFECYYAARHGDPVDPPTVEHLTDCSACSARYGELVDLLDAVRQDAEDESDAVFTPERLAAQQHHIARRLDHVGRPARVITFPHPFVRTTGMPSSSHSAPRWIAAAAAAGLFVGVAAGAAYRTPRPVRAVRGAAVATATTRSAPAPAPAALEPLGTAGNATDADVADDDAFLSDLDIALERPHSRELLVFDELTPHVREIGNLR